MFKRSESWYHRKLASVHSFVSTIAIIKVLKVREFVVTPLTGRAVMNTGFVGFDCSGHLAMSITTFTEKFGVKILSTSFHLSTADVVVLAKVFDVIVVRDEIKVSVDCMQDSYVLELIKMGQESFHEGCSFPFEKVGPDYESFGA